MSRINAPRGTVAAFALLVVAMLLFGIAAQVHGRAVDSPADTAQLETATCVAQISER